MTRYRSRPLVFFGVYALLLAVVFEGSARLFWKRRLHAPLWGRPSKVLHLMYYPELEQFERARADAASFDILALGASSLVEEFGHFPSVFTSQISSKSARRVRLFNVAALAHSSLDDYIKYRYLAERHFDLVLLYDGINETRANNCPPEVFQADYSHYSWYRQVNLLLDPVATSSVFLYTLKYLGISVVDRFQQRAFVPTHAPSSGWLQFGRDVKTPASLRDNVSRIIALSARRREPLVLMTLATYVPDNYSLQRFNEKHLDYAGPGFPVEMWGLPSNVRAAIDAHNAVISGLATQHPEAYFVDQERFVPKQGDYFSDFCHLSPRGMAAFCNNLLPTVLGVMADRGLRPQPR